MNVPEKRAFGEVRGVLVGLSISWQRLRDKNDTVLVKEVVKMCRH